MKFAHFLTLALALVLVPSVPATLNSGEISLITIAPRQSIAERFGHSLLKVSDAQGKAVCWNWGAFSFEDPLFIPKFLKGELFYRREILPSYACDVPGAQRASWFLTEQNLKNFQYELSIWEKPENEFFAYHFFRKNCATIIRDLLASGNPSLLEKKNIFSHNSLREHVHRALGEPWILWPFVDLFLTSGLDAPLSLWDEMFHPQFLHFHAKGGCPPPGLPPLGYGHKGYGFWSALWWGLWFFKKSYFLKYWSWFSGLLGLVMSLGWAFSNHDLLHHNGFLWLFWPSDFWGLRLKKKFGMFHGLTRLVLALGGGFYSSQIQDMRRGLLFFGILALAAFYYQSKVSYLSFRERSVEKI